MSVSHPEAAYLRTHALQSAWCLLVVAAILGSGVSRHASAAASVEVVDTFPAGKQVTLARNQNFNLRLAYSTDAPVGIWIQPYYKGKRVAAGTSPSVRHSGTGETIAWFFFMQPGDQVDEIRITAGDGAPGRTPVVATHRVHVVAGSASQSAGIAPAWVSEFRERARAAQRKTLEAQQGQPTSAFDMALFAGFMLAVVALGVGSFAAPVWMLVRWRGIWRAGAATIFAVMAFVVLRIVFDVVRDPTSHNLWPFEILLAGALSVVACVILMLLRRVLIPK